MARGKSKSKPAPRQRLIEAAMALAAQDGWHGTSMAKIAAAAEMPLADALTVFPSRTALLMGLVDDIDTVVLNDAAEDAVADDAAKDRLFDILMRRFDALAPYKDGLAAVAFDHRQDPLTGLCHVLKVQRSMAKMLELAGVPSHGFCGLMRTKGLMVVYACALRAWFRDTSPDMAATMAALDRGLRRAAGVASRFDRGPA